MHNNAGRILRGSAMALMLCLTPALAHSQQSMELGGEMISAAEDFIASLNEMQRNSALFDFDDDERGNWFFTPVDRRGVSCKAMDESQRDAPWALRYAGLARFPGRFRPGPAPDALRVGGGKPRAGPPTLSFRGI